MNITFDLIKNMYRNIKDNTENVKPPKKIIRYVRTDDGRPLGCVVAVGNGLVGWSFCRKGDTFTKKKAIEIATGRAFIKTNAKMPRIVVPLYNKVYEISTKMEW